MSSKPIEIRISRPAPAGDEEPAFPPYDGPPVLSYGFRPFFLSAALFAGLVVPLWVILFAGASGAGFLYPPREWHVHEMLFGFLPAVMSGFLLTAVPNWTGRPPLRGMPLLWLWLLWLAGRGALAVAWPVPSAAAVVDGAFLAVLAAYLWRELAAAGAWGQAPIGVLISLYAVANLLFHARLLNGLSTDLPERMVLSALMLLLTAIGGRIAPNFTREYLMQQRVTPLPPPFSRFDGLSMAAVAAAAAVWIARPDTVMAGGLFVAAGLINLVRVARWTGWLAWREPLVLVLHAGYSWLVLSMVALGGALLGIGLAQTEALHVLTTGAVGTMTLGVMTRASLGHTGRPKQVGPLTVAMYLMVSAGALLRVFVPAAASPAPATHLVLGLAAFAWAGAYLLFALAYGPYLLRPSLDE